MKTRWFKVLLSVCLAAALAAAPATVSIADSSRPGLAADSAQSAAVKNKEEVVYASLSADGNVNAVYAVNHFDVAAAGGVTDYGRYASVVNLTNTGAIASDGETVSFEAEEGQFYYQGNMASAELPWLLDISYNLDGINTAPQELAGKSGSVTIHITTKPNEKSNPVFYDNYLLQISVTLDTEKCGDINAPEATIASAGKNTIVTYTVMPQKNADISISASVEDFTMAGIQISGMPFAINIATPETDDMLSDFEKLSDAISDLNDGVGDLNDGVADLYGGAQRLEDGSAGIKNGLLQLRNNSGQLVAASSQINTALSQISSSLSGALSGGMDFGSLTQLPQALNQLSAGLKDMSDGLTGLKNGFSPAYAALDAAIRGIPDTALTQNQIDTLYAATDPGQHGVLDTLTASYTAGQTVKSTYDQVKSAFDAVAPTIDTISGSVGTIAASLDQMSDGIEALSGTDIAGQLGQLDDGLSQLAKNYADFHKGLADYMAGVADMANGYSGFHDGLSRFHDGVGELCDGIDRLHEGTAELNDNTADMPETMQTQIDDMMDEYTGTDFEPVSFTSSQNLHTGLVQFVFKCDGIEKPEAAEQTQPEQDNETIWDRLISLF